MSRRRPQTIPWRYRVDANHIVEENGVLQRNITPCELNRTASVLLKQPRRVADSVEAEDLKPAWFPLRYILNKADPKLLRHDCDVRKVIRQNCKCGLINVSGGTISFRRRPSYEIT